MQQDPHKPIDLKLPQSDHPQQTLYHRDQKKLSIVLLVSIIFLVLSLIAASIFAYLYFSPKAPVVITPDKRDTVTVKKVEWIAPSLPEDYAMHGENGDYTTSTVYQSDSCKITAKVEPTPSEPPQNEGVMYYIKDVDTVHEYEFNSKTESQSIDAPGTDVSSLTGVKVYKTFNYQLASLTYLCKPDVWESKKLELDELIKQFMVKTERVEE